MKQVERVERVAGADGQTVGVDNGGFGKEFNDHVD